MKRGKIYNLPTEHLVQVVADGMIASPAIAGNPLLPVAIVDTSDHAALAELIRLHRNFPPGDVISQWARRIEGRFFTKENNVLLHLTFLRPISLKAVIEFDIEKRPTLIDFIIRQRCMYLQSGHAGASLSGNFDEPRIFVEINASGFDTAWDKLFTRIIRERLRSQGRSRHEVKEGARNYISWVRDVARLRAPEK